MDQMPAESSVERSMSAPVLVFNIPGPSTRKCKYVQGTLLRPGLPIGRFGYARSQRTARREDCRM